MISLIRVYITLIALFPLTTLLQGYISSINRIICSLLIITSVLIVVKRPLKKNIVVFLGLSVISLIFSLVNTGQMPYNMNIIFYFLCWTLNVIIFSQFPHIAKKQLVASRKIFLGITCIWEILVLVSMLFPSSYVYGAGVISFASFTGDTFRLCTSTFQILSYILILLISYDRKRMILLLIVPLATIFMCGSRTYFVIGVVLVVFCMYRFFKKKKHFYMAIIPMVIICAMFFAGSAVGSKFQVTNQEGYYGYLATFTSGRSDFWVVDINGFLNANIYNKLIGFGFNKSIDLNNQTYGNPIWSHNDFIECLLTGGILQLFIYLWSIKILFSAYFKKKNILFFAMLWCVWFFDAFFNMFYTYFGTSLGVLLTICFLNDVAKRHLLGGINET